MPGPTEVVGVWYLLTRQRRQLIWLPNTYDCLNFLKCVLCLGARYAHWTHAGKIHQIKNLQVQAHTSPDSGEAFIFYFTMNSQHSKQIIFFRSLICRHMQHSSVHYTVCFGFNAVPKVNVQNLNLNLRTSASPEESGHENVPLLSVSLHQVLYNLYLFLF